MNTTNDIWVSKGVDTPWAFQIMVIDMEDSSWVYRRNKLVKREIEEIFLKSDTDIPYLRPEIQLLYKAGALQVRDKDYRDFQTMLPSLLPQEKAWLKSALKLQFPLGHDWVAYLGV